MSTTIAPVPAYGTPEWVADRRSYIGASDVAQILGVSPFGGSYDLYATKRGLVEIEETPALRMGHRLEPIVAELYAERFPDAQLREAVTMPHPQYPWLRATLDRIVDGPYGTHPLEIKTTNAFLHENWGDEGTDAIPDHVLVQVQTQMLVAEFSFAHVAVLIGGVDFRAPYIIERDREMQELILDRCADWHARYLAGDEVPEIDGPNAEQHLRRKYQSHSELMVTADEKAEALMVSLFDARAQQSYYEAIEGEAKAALMQIIGNHRGIIGKCGRITWAETKGRSSVDTKGLLAQLKVPESVLQQFTRTGAPSRQFRPTAAKV